MKMTMVNSGLKGLKGETMVIMSLLQNLLHGRTDGRTGRGKHTSQTLRSDVVIHPLPIFRMYFHTKSTKLIHTVNLTVRQTMVLLLYTSKLCIEIFRHFINSPSPYSLVWPTPGRTLYPALLANTRRKLRDVMLALCWATVYDAGPALG